MNLADRATAPQHDVIGGETVSIDWNDPAAVDALAAELDAQDEARRRRLERPEAIAESACWYAAHQIPVFPLWPRGKLPVIPKAHPDDDDLQDTCRRACGRDGHGLYDATTDPDRVAAWWRRWPQANIGVRTGLRFDVVDIDGPRGVLSIAGNADQPDYITLLRQQALGIVSTPRSGGLHYYVPPGAERKNTAKSLLPGVDTRGSGGYAILPPSVTDEHGPGRRYTWVTPLAVG